ncbi:MAG: hypothetical protein Q4G02_02575 [bacterium]|nr:hypothetical protein [bacterium]
MKNTLLSAFFCASLVFIQAGSSVLAQETTESGDVVIEKKSEISEHDQTATNQILDNLERLAKDPESSEKIKEKYDGVVNKNRGFIAQVTNLKDSALRVQTPNGEDVFITPDKSTTIIKKGKSTTGENLTLSEWFTIDDWLVLIGVQNNDVFSPRRIIIASETPIPEEQFVLRGTMKSSQSKKIEVNILGQEKSESFTIDKNVNLVNQANETITVKDLTIEAPVLLIGTIKNNKKTLQTLRLL